MTYMDYTSRRIRRPVRRSEPTHVSDADRALIADVVSESPHYGVDEVLAAVRWRGGRVSRDIVRAAMEA